MVCGIALNAVLLPSTAQMDSRRGLPSVNVTPTGCCIHEFAARMKYAEAMLASENAHAHARCTRLGSRSQPKIHSPRNVDSTTSRSARSARAYTPSQSDVSITNANRWPGRGSLTSSSRTVRSSTRS